MRKIILASQSPQRQALFKTLGVPFEIIPADLDEKAIQDDDLVKRAEKVARAKAEAIAVKQPSAIIIAADTFISFNGQALEKPLSLEEAKEMLRLQSGKTTTELTGFCYIDPEKNINISTAVLVDVTFRELSESEIDAYVNNNPVMTWSAAFCPAYEAGAALIATINGSFTAFTHGLPIEEVTKYLLQSGVELAGSK